MDSVARGLSTGSQAAGCRTRQTCPVLTVTVAAMSFEVPADWTPTTDDSPWHRLGGSDTVVALVEQFYDHMSEHEPPLARLHPCDEQGRVDRVSRDNFAMFLVGWLGGPKDYLEKRGHPALRMRHSPFPVDIAMRDAWMRSMRAAMEQTGVGPNLFAYLDQRFAHVADFLRNRAG